MKSKNQIPHTYGNGNKNKKRGSFVNRSPSFNVLADMIEIHDFYQAHFCYRFLPSLGHQLFYRFIPFDV